MYVYFKFRVVHALETKDLGFSHAPRTTGDPMPLVPTPGEAGGLIVHVLGFWDARITVDNKMLIRWVMTSCCDLAERIVHILFGRIAELIVWHVRLRPLVVVKEESNSRTRDVFWKAK